MNTPFFSTPSKIILALALIASGYFGAQALRTNLEAAHPRQPQQLTANLDAIDRALHAERVKPRFVGDVSGIFIAPDNTEVPPQYATFDRICKGEQGRSVPWEQAGELDLQLELPDTYVLQKDDINTDVVACGDTVFVARRVYSTPSGDVIIGRSRFDYDQVDVAVDRPKAEHINGRDVVIVDPLTPDGTFQNAYAWFPEPFGKTFISAVSLSQADFRELVALVASSTR